jgi:hypothetical protein
MMVPRPGQNIPIIIERMLIRRTENLRDTIPAGHDARRPPFRSKLRGMPLGLPAISDGHIAALWGWINRNCPPPKDGVGLDDMATFRQVLPLLKPGAPFFDPRVRPVTKEAWQKRKCGLPPGAAPASPR